jgi:hypothetical protein
VVGLSRGGWVEIYGIYIFKVMVAKASFEMNLRTMNKEINRSPSYFVLKMYHFEPKIKRFLVLVRTYPVPFFDGF